MPYKVHSDLRNAGPRGLLKIASGKKLHASNPGYSIQNAVYNRFLDGELIADELLKTDNKQQKQLLDIVCDLANRRKNGQLTTSAQVAEAEKYITENLHLMTLDFLDRIEQIATASGLLVLACAIHGKCEQLVLMQAEIKKPYSKRSNARLFWACLGNGQYDDAKQVYNKLRCNLSAPADLEFSKYIEGKRIAIVGPSSSGIDHSEEIACNFDITVTMNYNGIKTPAIEPLNLKHHISYYNGRLTGSITTPGENMSDFSYLKDLDFAVVKARKVNDRTAVADYTKLRDSAVVDGLFLRGAPNLLQVILLDLTHFQPACVKAFYLNIGLSETLHDKDYLKALNRTNLEPRDQWRSLAKHNPIMQYDYTSFLYKTGFLEADTRLTEVLELGTVEFMRQMEELENRKEQQFAKE